MTSLEALLVLGNFAWAYVIVLTYVWFRAVAQTDLRDHIGHFVGLMGVFVPGVSMVLMILLAGAMFGLPWLIAILVLAFPASIAAGLHLEVARLTPDDPWADGQRLVLTVLLALVITGYALRG
ncbi:MAG: hypothetical protein AAGM21_08765 [Pseudomonadota bacterium]